MWNFFGENNNYHQIGNGYLDIDITVRESDSTKFIYDDPVRLVNNGFAFCLKEGRLSTTLGSDIEHYKFCGQVSTIAKVISKKDGDVLSQFDYINENDIPVLERLADLPPQIRSTPHQKMLIKNHINANKGKIKRYLCQRDIFGFCKSFKKVSKNLGFHLMFKTANLQDIKYTSMADDINETINSLYLYIPNLIPSVETQLMFNEATQDNYEISYEEWYTKRRVIEHMIDQHDIGSAQKKNSPKYLIRAHQTKDRNEIPIKGNKIATFDNLDLQKSFVELDGQQYPKVSPAMSCEENDYFEQYKDLKLFFRECIGEPIKNPLISYPDMKTKYPIGKTGLRHQPDEITPKKKSTFLRLRHRS